MMNFGDRKLVRDRSAKDIVAQNVPHAELRTGKREGAEEHGRPKEDVTET